MAPHRFRGIQDDLRSESSVTRDKPLGNLQSGISKARRYATTAASTSGAGSTLKDVTEAPASKITFHHGHENLGLTEKVSPQRYIEGDVGRLNIIGPMEPFRCQDPRCVQASSSLERPTRFQLLL